MSGWVQGHGRPVDITGFAEVAENETISGAWTFTSDITLNDNVKLTLGTGGDADFYYDGTNVILNTRVVGSGDFDILGGNVSIAGTNRLEFGGAGSQTYIVEGVANVLRIFTGNVKTLELSTAGLVIPATQKFFPDGGGDTYIDEVASDVLRFVVGGGEQHQIRATGASFGGVVPGAQLHVVSGAAGRVGLIVDTAAATTAAAQEWYFAGALAAQMLLQASDRVLVIESFDNGAGAAPRFQLNRNSNVSTPSAGFLRLQDKGNTGYRLWPDDAGLFRIHTADPTNANDTAGTVVGDQTSWHELKDVLGPAISKQDAARSVSALAFERFAYKERSYSTWDGGNQEFNGLVVRDRVNDWWGKNVGPGQVPALNEIELFARYGLTLQAIIDEVRALGGFAWL